MSRVPNYDSIGDYRKSLAEQTLVIPEYLTWDESNFSLIHIEASLGVRVHLSSWCDFVKNDSEPMCQRHTTETLSFDLTTFDWFLHIYGPWTEITMDVCTATSEFLFSEYFVDSVSPPIPAQRLTKITAEVVTENSITFYIEKKHTEKINIGFYYIGAVTARSIDGAYTSKIPKQPPLWFYAQDSYKTYFRDWYKVPNGEGICR